MQTLFPVATSFDVVEKALFFLLLIHFSHSRRSPRSKGSSYVGSPIDEEEPGFLILGQPIVDHGEGMGEVCELV